MPIRLTFKENVIITINMFYCLLLFLCLYPMCEGLCKVHTKLTSIKLQKSCYKSGIYIPYKIVAWCVYWNREEVVEFV